MTFTLTELISYFGGLLGLLVTIIIVLFIKGNRLIKLSLILFMFIASISIILGTLTYTGKIVNFPHLFRLDSPLHYLFPSAVLFYVYASFKPGFRFKKIYLLNLLPFLFNTIQLLPFYFSSASVKIESFNQYTANGSVVMPVHYTLKAIFILVYFILQLVVFFRYKAVNGNRTKYQSSLIKWFWALFTAQAVLLGGLFSEILSGFNLFDEPYRFSMFMITFFVYEVSIALLFLPHMLYGNIPEEQITEKKYSRSILTEEEKIIILGKIERYLKNNDKPYLNPKLSLQHVSHELNVQPNQLSQVVNEKTGNNFNHYINGYRVEKSKTILTSPEYTKLTIEAIASLSGFNSKSQFYDSFKKHTGMTPKKFIVETKQNGL